MAPHTKRALQQSFLSLLNQRPFDKISVVDIAEHCGVNRNTFYYYYADIYALLEDVFQQQLQVITETCRKTGTWQAFFKALTAFARSNKKAVYHIYHSVNQDWLERFLYDNAHRAMVDYVSREARGLDVTPRDIHVLAAFYTAALLGLLITWINGGMQEDAAGYVEEIGFLLDGNIHHSLERCHQRRRETAAGN